MNLTNTFVFILVILLSLAGCKKEEITYPITLEFDRVESENGIRAYEEQGGVVTEINADPYRQDSDLNLDSLTRPDKIVITKETEATLFWGYTQIEAKMSVSGKKYEFSYSNDQGEYFTVEGKGDESELIFKGAVNKVVDAGTLVTLQSNGLCNYATVPIAGCNSLATVEQTYPNFIDDDEVLLVHYFEVSYKP